MRSSQEAMATHASVCRTLTASVLSASSLCSTRLVRSLGNLHVVAGERDPVFCEQWGSHRDKDSATTDTDTLNNLNMAHLQASSPLTRSEPFGDCTCTELDRVFLATDVLHTGKVWKPECVFSSLVWSASVGMNPILHKSRLFTHFSLLTLTVVLSESLYFGWGAPTRMV